jgi:hypothetical protein
MNDIKEIKNMPFTLELCKYTFEACACYLYNWKILSLNIFQEDNDGKWFVLLTVGVHQLGISYKNFDQLMVGIYQRHIVNKMICQ